MNFCSNFCLQYCHSTKDSKVFQPKCLPKIKKIKNLLDLSINSSKFLKQLVQQQKDKKNNEIISYNYEQKSFCVKSIRRFTQQVLPKYFIHKNYSSFVRQVNLYNFRKISQQGKQQVYQNDDFNIYNFKCLMKMKRKRINNNKIFINKKKFEKGENISQEIQRQHSNSIQKPRKGSIEQQQLPHESQNSSSYSDDNMQHNESSLKQSNHFQLRKQQFQEIRKRKQFLQYNIKIQKMASVRLLAENMHRKKVCKDMLVAISTNYQFNKDILQKMNKLIDSQFYAGRISRQTQLKLKKYNEAQIAKINNEQNFKKLRISKYNFQDKNHNHQQQSPKQSKYIYFIKKLLSNQTVARNILVLMRYLNSYVQNNENMFHPSKQIENMSFRIKSQQNESQKQENTFKQKQSRNENNILVRNHVIQANPTVLTNRVNQKPRMYQQVHDLIQQPLQTIKRLQAIQQYLMTQQSIKSTLRQRMLNNQVMAMQQFQNVQNRQQYPFIQAMQNEQKVQTGQKKQLVQIESSINKTKRKNAHMNSRQESEEYLPNK